MTYNGKIIQGSGGGGGSKTPDPPYRAPDSLHSRSFATIQDLISEGEIEGFASASKEGLTKGTVAYDNASLKDVFLDDTPIMAATANSSSPAAGDINFQDVTFKSKFGTSNQTAMSGIPEESRSPIAVAVIVQNADGTESGGLTGAVTRQITNTNVDAVIVTLTWPQLQRFEDNGDINGDSVSYKIQIEHDNGGYVTKIESSVSGRTADAYARDHRIQLTDGYSTVNIRVIRVTADSTQSTVQNAFEFTSFQEVIDNPSTYPNSAYLALRFDSKQFNRIPSRKYRIRGIKVRIPGAGAANSGTPVVDNDTGRIVYPSGYIFNGTMGAAVYTNCPAMCLLDLLTNTRYGFGDHITDSNLDLFSFVAASKYSNELVDDGTGAGTTEARFSCNVNIQSPSQAFDVINALSGVMRCMPIWSAGSVTISQDKPLTPSYLFNLSNVTEQGFSYSGSSLKQRHSIFSVAYFNMDSKEVDFEVVGDSDSADDTTRRQKLGTAIKKVSAFACTSRNQAARLGRAMMFAEELQSEIITFSTSIDAGVVVRPGQVIEVNDPVRAGVRRGGRVVAATTGTVTIDAESSTRLTTTDSNGNIDSGPGLTNSPTISVILPDGTVETKSITANSSGVLTLSSTLSAVPNVNSPYLISSTTLQTQQFRVLQVEEKNATNYAITAITYIAGKYDFIENGTPLPSRTISLLNQPAAPPSALTISEKTIVINNIARSKLIVDWQPVEGVTQYQVNYKYKDGNYVSQVVFSSDFELLDTPVGEYTFEVFSYNAALNISANSTTKTFTAIGKTALPDNPTGLTIEPVNEEFVRLRFNQSTAIDVLHGGRVYVRHTNQTGGSATFQTAQDVIEAVAGSATEAICPSLEGTYLVKFQDDGGRFSATAARVSLSTVQLVDSIIVKTDREDTDSTPFNGTKTNVVYDSTLGGLKLTNPATNSTGTYDFVETLDLGGIFSLQMKRYFQGVGFYTGDQFDNRTELIDTWLDFDGSIAENANAKLSVRTTTDTGGSPTYTDFNDIANGAFRGRQFQFRATLETTDSAQNINLQQLGYTATMSSRTEQSAVIASGSAAKSVTFTNPFFVGTSALGNLNNFLPAVSISPQNMGTGDYYEITNVSGTGFTVHFKNASNASIDRNFTYTAVGFGKGG